MDGSLSLLFCVKVLVEKDSWKSMHLVHCFKRRQYFTSVVLRIHFSCLVCVTSRPHDLNTLWPFDPDKNSQYDCFVSNRFPPCRPVPPSYLFPLKTCILRRFYRLLTRDATSWKTNPVYSYTVAHDTAGSLLYSHWIIPCDHQSVAWWHSQGDDRGRLHGCQSNFPALHFTVSFGEHRSAYGYFNGDSKSWCSMRPICG